MMWLSLMVLVAGIGLTLVSALRKHRSIWLSSAGALVAGFSAIAAASIGLFFIPLAFFLLAAAAWQLGRTPRTA